MFDKKMFSEVIKNLREDRKLTQAALAEKSNLSEHFISRIEIYKEPKQAERKSGNEQDGENTRARANVTIGTIEGLAQGLGITTYELLELSDDGHGNDKSKNADEVFFLEYKTLSNVDKAKLHMALKLLSAKSEKDLEDITGAEILSELD